MPWTAADAKQKKQGLSDKQAQTWAKVANDTLKRELAKRTPRPEAERRAIMAANAASKGASESLAARQTRNAAAVPLQEYAHSAGLTLRVDRDQGIIRGVKILGLESRNGRRYTTDAILRAASLYEGVKVNVNHPPPEDPDAPRDYGDRLGNLRGVQAKESGLYGDLHFNPKHALAEQLSWDAENAPQNLGLSHNVRAVTKRGNGELIVEEITQVQSVDVVADPATTHGLFESEQIEPQEDSDMSSETWSDATVAVLEAERPDLLKAIREQALAEQSQSDEAKAKDAKLASLTEELATFKAAAESQKREAAIAKLLEDAKLPEAVVDDNFRAHLLTLEAEQAKAFIEHVQAAYKTGATTKPRSTEQGGEGYSGDVKDGKTFAGAVT